MSHWFDRLAVKAATAKEERLLTRREAVKSAAAGAVAVGALGSPLVSAAFGLTPCECQARVNKKAERDMAESVRNFYSAGTFINAAATAIWVTENTGIIFERVGGIVNCGKCEEDKQSKTVGKEPPEAFHPCTHRGGLALRDQCGGAPPPSGGGQQCPNGTHLCTDGLCCFGTDLCCANCGTGQCCVVEVGCACCG